MILSGPVIEELVQKTKRLKADRLLDLGGMHADTELIDIEPFRPEQLNPNSYNLRLAADLLVYAPTEYAARGPGEPLEPVLDSARDNPVAALTIPPEGLILWPGRLYLGCTEEWTETYNLVPTIEGRSSVGRLGVQTHMTAGFGETFFCGQWTLEIAVLHPVRVYPSTQICQVVFSQLAGRSPAVRYVGKYQNQRGPRPSRLWKEFPQPGGTP